PTKVSFIIEPLRPWPGIAVQSARIGPQPRLDQGKETLESRSGPPRVVIDFREFERTGARIGRRRRADAGTRSGRAAGRGRFAGENENGSARASWCRRRRKANVSAEGFRSIEALHGNIAYRPLALVHTVLQDP